MARRNPILAVMALVALAWAMTTTLCVPDVAHAGTCTVSALSPTGTILPGHLDRRYNQVEACINGKIGDSNIDSAEPISLTKIAKPTSVYTVSVQLPCGTDSDAFAFLPPFTSEITSFAVRCKGCTAANHDLTLKAASTTVKSFNLTDSTPQSDAALATDVSTSTTIKVEAVQTTAGSCGAYDVVIGLKTPHTGGI